VKGLTFNDKISDACIETQQRGYIAPFGLIEYKTKLRHHKTKSYFRHDLSA
jgi:hypothetical protein